MFRTRAVNRKINRLRERGLTASLNDETTTFNGMLSKGNGDYSSCKKYSNINDEILQLSLRFYQNNLFTKRIL